ncbi:MAG: hypothetical protein J5J00_01585 [Deltaproteobacteria bacterium]|nr:hypothetical protein [Deltaproteobacteria bacterium]
MDPVKDPKPEPRKESEAITAAQIDTALMIADLDYALMERLNTTLKPLSQAGMMILLDSLDKKIEARMMELIKEMEKRGYELSYQALISNRGEDPAVVVTARHMETGSYGIPNVNFLDEIAPPLERGESLNPREKQLMSSYDEDEPGKSPLSRFQVEQFSPDMPVRFIIRQPSMVDKSFDFNVQYSPPAFESAFRKVAHCLSGEETGYCHLYHEVVLGTVRSSLYELSGGVFGQREFPEIDSEKSGVSTRGEIHVKAFCPISPNNEGESWPLIRISAIRDDDFSPYPFAFQHSHE